MAEPSRIGPVNINPNEAARGGGAGGVGSPRDRRHSILADFMPGSLQLPSSFIATSPMVREILARDIAECSSGSDDHSSAGADDEGEDDDASRRSSLSDAASLTHVHSGTAAAADEVPLAFHPTGVAFGLGYSVVPIQGVDRPGAAAPAEVEASRAAELSLLRDNALLPPKHGSRGPPAGVFGRLYRALFSTKVRDHEQPLLDQIMSAMHPDEEYEGPVDENTSLLGGRRPSDRVSIEIPPTPAADEVHERFEEAVAAHVIKTTWQREAKTLVQYAAPLIVTFLLHYSVTIGSVLTVGRLGMVELAAVNLATMTASITCYVPVQGLATCLDTLCAQAYGSGHKHLVGLQAQRMTWLLWFIMAPIAVVWWFSEPILVALVPDRQTAALAALYLRVLILGMPGVAAFESGKRFVQSQGLFHATTYVLLLGAPLSFLQNYLFVFRFDWGFGGAALAMSVTQNLLPILLAVYVRCFEGMECWRGMSKKAFSNWGPMIRLALPGMIMIEAQFSVLEILTVAAGQFGTAQLAAQSVLVTVTSTSFNVPFPLAIATSTRVANLIGAHLSSAAQTTAKVAIICALLVGSVNLSLLAGLRVQLPEVFTDDTEVVGIASRAILVCAVMQIFDALAAVSHGILRGVGRQAIGGYANLFAYYCVALPISLGTAFGLGWKLAGLWTGLTVGLAAVSALELLYLYNADWESAVAQAEARMRSEDVVADPKFADPN